jgi:6-pyruvoyltetrahydropterin/6-carboxytetrahydropterin synthase
MYSVHVSTTFRAIHSVTIHGETEEPHEHNWCVDVIFEGDKLNEDGVLIDFIEVENTIKTIVKPFVGKNLNSIEIFEGINPTAERVAMYIGDTLHKQIQAYAKLRSITVTEAPNCKATYTL